MADSIPTDSAEPGSPQPAAIAQPASAGPLERPQQATAQGPGLSPADLPTYSRSLLRIRVPVVVSLAQKRQPLGRIMELGPGSMIHFEKSCEESLESRWAATALPPAKRSRWATSLGSASPRSSCPASDSSPFAPSPTSPILPPAVPAPLGQPIDPLAPRPPERHRGHSPYTGSASTRPSIPGRARLKTRNAKGSATRHRNSPLPSPIKVPYQSPVVAAARSM